MSGGFAESDAEEAALGWLETLGYTVRHGPEIAYNVDGGERRRKTIGSLGQRLRHISAVGQRLGQVRKMNDEALLLVRFEPSWIAIRHSRHRPVAFLFQIARSKAQLTQHRSQQTGPDLLAAVFQSSAARAAVKGRMAALALQFIDAHLDPALLTEPSQSAQQLVSGHAPSNRSPARDRQGSNWTFLSNEQRPGR